MSQERFQGWMTPRKMCRLPCLFTWANDCRAICGKAGRRREEGAAVDAQKRAIIFRQSWSQRLLPRPPLVIIHFAGMSNDGGHVDVVVAAAI